MDTLLRNDDGTVIIGTYDPTNTLLRLSADQYTAGSATWADQSGNGLDFTVSTNTSLKGTDADGFPYMNFGGSYGIAKRIVSSALTNITAPTTNKYTIFCVTQILNSTTAYRTLTRGSSEDHQVIVQTGNNNLGLFDTSFLDSLFDITTAMTNSRNLLVWELSTSSPIYNFQLNESGTNSTITTAANFTLPFATIGGASSASQYWGNIYEFIVYDGHLTASDRAYVAEYLTYKWGIYSKLPSPTSTQGVITHDSIGALDRFSSTVYNKTIAAYALRRLFSAYTGPQVKLKRSSDNAQTDVYFDRDGNLVNPLDLDTWLGANTGYVVTWYDQSSAAKHTTGYGTTLPSIYKRADGLYVIYFPGTSTTAGGYFNSGSFTFNVATNGGVSTFSRANFLTANSWERLYDYGSGSSSSNFILARNSTSLTLHSSLRQGTTAKQLEITNGISNSTWQSYGIRVQGSGSSWVFSTRVDGVETTGAAQSITYTDRTIANSYIGRSHWSGDQYSNMYLACLIFFDTGSITSEQFGVMENVIY